MGDPEGLPQVWFAQDTHGRKILPSTQGAHPRRRPERICQDGRRAETGRAIAEGCRDRMESNRRRRMDISVWRYLQLHKHRTWIDGVGNSGLGIRVLL